MAKLKTVYICSSCGEQFMRWSGQCNSCKEWNTLQEDVIDTAVSKAKKEYSVQVVPKKISDGLNNDLARFKTKITEFDRVLGGGIVPGEVILLGGEPGIGKSTLTLQILDKLSVFQNILYIAGEESVSQIAIRAKRLNLKIENVTFLETNSVESVLSYLAENKVDFIVLDSIQVVKSLENSGIGGGVTQIRYVTEKLVEYAKSNNVPTLFIGHVTKDGELAGPKVLEHLVDCVIYIEGDRVNTYRFLKTVKNRFGPTDEVGLFKMAEKGLIEISDPTMEFLETRDKAVIGSALSCIIEGNRPILIEVQALTSKSNFGYPKRSATGFDINRLAMIIAVLNKYYGVDLSEFDVFINITGGFKVKDTGSDLAIMQALRSSFKKIALTHDTVHLGEISLTGDIRKVSYQELRQAEIKRLGFKLNTKFE